MLRLSPKYVTVDEFKSFTGLDLRNILRTDDNESNQAELFLLKVEDHLINWIDCNTFRRIGYDCLNSFQMDNFKKAILTQAYYTFKNGAIALGMESGYDAEKGIVVDFDKLAQLEVCQAAIEYLSNAGLFNLVMKNRPRVMNGYPGLEFTGYDGGGGGGSCPCPPQPQPQPCPPVPPTPRPGVITGIGYTEDVDNGD